eukprot:5174576-Amphidinium_carterae.1
MMMMMMMISKTSSCDSCTTWPGRPAKWRHTHSMAKLAPIAALALPKGIVLAHFLAERRASKEAFLDSSPTGCV